MKKGTEQKVFDDIIAERRRQDAKWGVQAHAPATWFIILAEEVGEAARTLLEDRSNWRKELVQVAAVAVAAIEAYDEEATRGGYYASSLDNDSGGEQIIVVPTKENA